MFIVVKWVFFDSYTYNSNSNSIQYNKKYNLKFLIVEIKFFPKENQIKDPKENEKTCALSQDKKPWETLYIKLVSLLTANRTFGVYIRWLETAFEVNGNCFHSFLKSFVVTHITASCTGKETYLTTSDIYTILSLAKYDKSTFIYPVQS